MSEINDTLIDANASTVDDSTRVQEILYNISKKMNGRRGSSVDMAIQSQKHMSELNFVIAVLGPIVYENIFKTIETLVDFKTSVDCTLRSIGYLPELFKEEVFWKIPKQYILWLVTGLNYIFQDSNEKASRFRCLWSDAVHKTSLISSSSNSRHNSTNSLSDIQSEPPVITNKKENSESFIQSDKSDYDDVILTLFNIFDVFYMNMNRELLESQGQSTESDIDPNNNNSIYIDTHDPIYMNLSFEFGKFLTTLLKPGMSNTILYKLFFYISNKSPLRNVFLNILSTLFTPSASVPSIYYHISGGDGIDFKYSNYPFNNGFFFGTYIYVERQMLKKQYILNIKDSNDNGIALYIDNGILCVLFSPPKKAIMTLQLPIRIEPKQWKFVSLAITKKRWKDDQFSICINNELVYENKCTLPVLDSIPVIQVGKDFFGSISDILFASNDLPSSILQDMVTIPPQNDVSPWDIRQNVLKHRDEWGKYVVAYFSPSLNAGVSDRYSRCIMDVYSNWIGTISRDSYIWRSNQCQNVLYVCGGSKSLLPLFSIVNNRDTNDKTPCYLINLLSLLSHYIEGSELHQQEVYMNRSINIISTLLARASSTIMEEGGAIEGLMQLYTSADYIPLKQQIVDDLFLNHSLWLHSSISIQIQFFNRLLLLIEDDPYTFTISKLTIQYILLYIKKMDDQQSLLLSNDFSKLIKIFMNILFVLLPYSINKMNAENIVYLSFSIQSPSLQSYLILFVSKLLYPSEYTLDAHIEENPYHSVKLPEYTICQYIYAALQTLPTTISNLLSPLLIDPLKRPLLLPPYLSLVTSFIVFLLYIQDDDTINKEHISNMLSEMKDTEAGLLLTEIMKSVNLDQSIYNALMNLVFQNGDGLDLYVNNTIPKHCDIHCLFALQLIFDRIAYTTDAEVQQQFITDINILMSSSDINTNMITTINGWDIYLLYLIYKFMKKGEKYNLRYVYKYCYMYMEDAMKEQYDSYVEQKKDEKLFRSQYISSQDTNINTKDIHIHHHHIHSSTGLDAYLSNDGNMSPIDTESLPTHPNEDSSVQTNKTASMSHDPISDPSLLLKRKEDIDTIINGTIDLISRLIYESIVSNIQTGCTYIYRIIAASKIFSTSYFLGYMLLFRILYYIKSKIAQEIALNEQYSLPLRLFDFLYNFIPSLPFLSGPSPLYTPPPASLFNVLGINPDTLSLYKYITNDLNIHVDNYEDEDFKSMNIDETSIDHSQLYRKNICMYRHECTCTSCDYDPIKLASIAHAPTVSYCNHCKHLHMIYIDDDTGMNVEIYGGIMYRNLLYLMGIFYRDFIMKSIKTKEVAMWLIRERDVCCILVYITQITFIELHQCDINIPLFSDLLGRLTQQVAMIANGYKKSKKIDIVMCYIILEIHQLLQRIQNSINDYDDKNYFISLANKTMNIMKTIHLCLPSLPSEIISWYIGLEEIVEANKEYTYEEGDFLETHWIFEDSITDPLLPLLPYNLLTSYAQDYYYHIKNIFNPLPDIIIKIKEDIESKKEINMHTKSVYSSTHHSQEGTTSISNTENSDKAEQEREEFSEESSDGTTDSSDSDYIDDYLYIDTNEGIVDDINEKKAEGLKNTIIIVNELNRRMSVYTKQYDDNEKLYLIRFRDLLRLYNREGYLYNSNINIDKEAFWIIDNRQDRMGKNMQYIYNYNYTSHEENVYKEEMKQNQENEFDQLLSTMKKGDIDTDIDINSNEEHEDLYAYKNTFHNLYRYVEGYKKTYSNVSILYRYHPIEGRIILSSTYLFFIPSDFSACPPLYRPISFIKEILPRKSIGSPLALELFFAGGATYFFVFPSKQQRQDFFDTIYPYCSSITTPHTFDLKTIFESTSYTSDWLNRHISTLEYLMILNKYSGRSIQDLTQYYVFPWILKDYTSDSIDLKNENVYRDLSKPMGALNEDRWNEISERYDSLKEVFDDTNKDIMNIPPFMFGSHYSTEGIVLYYLLRIEPYTTLNIQLQGGRFDCPERLFYSLKDAFYGTLTSSTDFKELIPEFYYNKDIFVNKNNLPLGYLTQDTSSAESITVNDVSLPPYAPTANEMVKILRRALESDYVSTHIHSWIDLIFGFKQRGQAAEEAGNVFYYLTYDDVVDISTIEDPAIKETIAQQIMHYGQCPSQIFTEPHPSRASLSFPLMKWYLNSSRCAIFATEKIAGCPPLISITLMGNKIECIFKNMTRCITKLSYKNKNMTIKMDKIVNIHDSVYSLASYARTNNKINIEKDKYTLNTSAVAIPSSGPYADKYLFTALNWDKSIHIVDLSSSSSSFTSINFNYLCTCVLIDSNGRGIYIGTNDGLVFYGYMKDGERRNLQDFMLVNNEYDYLDVGNSGFVVQQILYGQKSSIITLAVNNDIDILVTSSSDGTLCLYSAMECNYIRRITSPKKLPYESIALSKHGFIACLCSSTNSIDIYNVNGEYINTYTNDNDISTIHYTHDGLCLLVGTTIGFLYLIDNKCKELNSLNFTIYGGITCMNDDENMYTTCVGTDKGVVIVLVDTPATEYFNYSL